MGLILSVLILFNINGFLLSLVILGICFLCKMVLHRISWTEVFDQLGFRGLLIVVLISLFIFTAMAYSINFMVFKLVNSDYAIFLAWFLPVIIDVIMLTQIKRGKAWLIHGDEKSKQETIYK